MSPTKLARTPLALKTVNHREKFVADGNSCVKPLSYRKLSENEAELTKTIHNSIESGEKFKSLGDILKPSVPLSNLCLYTRRLNLDEMENLWKRTTLKR